RERRRWRDGAHPAGVRARVTRADALVVARGRERDDGFAVDERLKAGLLAGEELLEHDRTAVRGRRADRGARLLRRGAHGHALAHRESVGFHDEWHLPPLERPPRRLGIGEELGPRGRDAGAGHELLRERLAPLDLRRVARWPDDRDPTTPQRVADAVSDEVVRTDDPEIDVRRREMLLQPARVTHWKVEEPCEERHPGIPRDDVDRGDAVRPSKTPGDRVFAPTTAEDDAVRAGRAARATRA